MTERNSSVSRRLALGVKRAFDIASSILVGVAVFPLFPVIALLVKATSPGPVLFRQDRAGLGQRPFRMYKFRTMVQSTEDCDLTRWSASEEARITSVGRFFRNYGLDELPQVINILKGDMSVIGPRPPLPVQVEEFTVRQKRMFDMRPGVLSLAVIMGRRAIPPEQRIEYHVKYVENWSLLLDLEILLKSILVVFGKQNAEENLSKET